MTENKNPLFEGDGDMKIAGEKAPEISPDCQKAQILEQLEEADEDGKLALAKLVEGLPPPKYAAARMNLKF